MNTADDVRSVLGLGFAVVLGVFLASCASDQSDRRPPETDDTDGGAGADGDSGADTGNGKACSPTGYVDGTVSNRSYRLYLPKNCDQFHPIPMIVALHGSNLSLVEYIENIFVYGGNGVADWANFVVLAPENGSADHNSWSTADQQPIYDMIAKVKNEYDIDPDRVYLHGYSSGAHYAYLYGLTNAGLFAAMGISAGGMAYLDEYAPDWAAEIAWKMPVAIYHGSRDQTVGIAWAEQAKAALEANGQEVYYHVIDRGHEMDYTDIQGMWTELFSRTTRP